MKDTPKISKNNIRSHQAMSCCAYHMVGKFGMFALLATGHLLAEMSVPVSSSKAQSGPFRAPVRDWWVEKTCQHDSAWMLEKVSCSKLSTGQTQDHCIEKLLIALNFALLHSAQVQKRRFSGALVRFASWRLKCHHLRRKMKVFLVELEMSK